MQRLVITSTSLYTDPYAASIIKHYDNITVIEDPVIFVGSKSKLVAVRAALKSYVLWLGSIVPDATITYVLRSQVVAKGPTIFDYLIGDNAQIHMWRQDLTLHEYGDRLSTYTYSGIGIKFIDNTDAWCLQHRYCRDEMKTRSAMQIKTQILNTMTLPDDLRAAVVKIINTRNIGAFKSRAINIALDTTDLYKAATDHVTRTYAVTGPTQRYAVNVIEMKQLLDVFVGKILPTYMHGDIIVMQFALSCGMILLKNLVKTIIDNTSDINSRAHAIADCCTFEYARCLYILDGPVKSSGIMKQSVNAQCLEVHNSLTSGSMVTIGQLRMHCASMRVCKQTKALVESLGCCAWINVAYAYMLVEAPIATCDMTVIAETYPRECAAMKPDNDVENTGAEKETEKSTTKTAAEKSSTAKTTEKSTTKTAAEKSTASKQPERSTTKPAEKSSTDEEPKLRRRKKASAVAAESTDPLEILKSIK